MKPETNQSKAMTLKQQTEQAVANFNAQLDALLLAIREKAQRQFDYNIARNVGNGMSLEAAAPHALEKAIVATCSARNHYDIEATIKLAANMLEDVNAHGEADELRAKL